MNDQKILKKQGWRVILATCAGLVLGMVVNSILISQSHLVIPPPEGTDLTTAEGITEALPLLKPFHFLMPFLAHALGTAVAVFVASLIAPWLKGRFILIFGVLNLAGGIAAAFMIPAPTWFIVADLVFAYLPFAFLGAWLAGLLHKSPK
jgi:hypothetical protein